MLLYLCSWFYKQLLEPSTLVSRGNPSLLNLLFFYERPTGGGLHFQLEMCLKCLTVARVQWMGNEMLYIVTDGFIFSELFRNPIFCYNLGFTNLICMLTDQVSMHPQECHHKKHLQVPCHVQILRQETLIAQLTNRWGLLRFLLLLSMLWSKQFLIQSCGNHYHHLRSLRYHLGLIDSKISLEWFSRIPQSLIVFYISPLMNTSQILVNMFVSILVLFNLINFITCLSLVGSKNI